MSSTILGYAATFSQNNNKKKVVRGLFLYHAFLSSHYFHQFLVKTNYGKTFNLATADHYELGKIAVLTIMTVLSFVFSLTPCGSSTKPASAKKKAH
jgi:hypothetical protein